jgi:nicotinamidase-related amidase
MIDVLPELARFAPPARFFDKHVYSPWTGSDLHQQLRGAGIGTIIITGGETDVCVLATMMGRHRLGLPRHPRDGRSVQLGGRDP